MFDNAALNMKRRGLSACGLGALDLTINKSNFLVGEAPGYSVSGAAINAPILWSSTKNGLPSGENLSDYGHKTDAMGVWSAPGGNWTTDQVGQWTKSVKVGDETDTVLFSVLSQGGAQHVTPGSGTAVTPAPKVVDEPGFFDGDVDLFGYRIPKLAAYGGGALLAYLLFIKKK